ncbi:hypothetical protein C0036_26840 [Streptomyces sp. DJ]|nr:hypothetical protein C0036_26840 [Streptomyces sp. DJ]
MVGRELSPADHSKKEVRVVLERLVAQGWSLRKAGHWGRLYCSCSDTCTEIAVGGTPENPSSAANRIARIARRCPLPQDDPRRPAGRRVVD